MPHPEQSPNREEKALQALVSAALHVKTGDVPLEEILPYLTGEVKLSAEDEAALEASRKARLIPGQVEQVETSEAEAIMALNRKRPPGGFSPKTEEEIKRKREELLEKLRKKKAGN